MNIRLLSVITGYVVRCKVLERFKLTGVMVHYVVMMMVVAIEVAVEIWRHHEVLPLRSFLPMMRVFS